MNIARALIPDSWEGTHPGDTASAPLRAGPGYEESFATCSVATTKPIPDHWEGLEPGDGADARLRAGAGFAESFLSPKQ